MVVPINNCIFAPTESATLPVEQRTRAGLFLYTHMDNDKIYNKLPLSIAEQIDRLKGLGLHFEDEQNAAKILGEVSYFRFVAYLRPLEADKLSHRMKPNATFEKGLAMYLFDNELRSILFSAIQKLEIALRTKIIQHFSMEHGSFWFMEMELADSELKFLDNLNALVREVNRSKEEFIKEHFQKYDKPEMPPVWKTLELATFGTLSKLYYNFADKKAKKRIARDFNLPNHEVLESWMRSVAALRNYCAHHSRLWNRKLNATPMLAIRLRGAWIGNAQSIDSNCLYAVLCVIAYWLDSMGYKQEFKNDLFSLLRKYPSVDVAAMGFPAGWQEETLWQ